METPIKIIKRKERELSSEEQLSVDACKTANQLRRQLAQTVALWIEERRTQVLFKSLPTVEQSE